MLEQCPSCRQMPCTCGYAYRNWSWSQRIELIQALAGKGPEPPTGLPPEQQLAATACFLLGKTLGQLQKAKHSTGQLPVFERVTEGKVLSNRGGNLVVRTYTGDLMVPGYLAPYEGRGCVRGTPLTFVVSACVQPGIISEEAERTPATDPNAPLEAFQRRLDHDHLFYEGRGGEFRQPEGVTPLGEGNHRLGHLPGIDLQEGSSDE